MRAILCVILFLCSFYQGSAQHTETFTAASPQVTYSSTKDNGVYWLKINNGKKIKSPIGVSPRTFLAKTIEADLIKRFSSA